jgi:hypothetical protein
MGRLARALPLAVYLSSVAVASQGPGTPASLTRIDALGTGEATAGLLSGVILVARGDRILLHRAYGFASWS